LVAAQRQRRSIAEKRRIVEETLVEGASSHAWRGRTASRPTRCLAGADYIGPGGWAGGASPAVKLLPVRVSESTALATVAHREHSLSADRAPSPASTLPGTIHIELRPAQVRIESSADPALVRVLLVCMGQ